MLQTLPASPQIGVISSTQRGAVTKDVLDVAERDYLSVLRSIALEEIGAQIQIGNKPTGYMIDGHEGGRVEDARRSITVWFADRRSLAAAIVEARTQIEILGRRVTGHTLGALAFSYSVGPGGRAQPCDPAQITATIANPQALDLYVSVPVVYTRKWQWLDRSGARPTRPTRNKTLNKFARATKSSPARVHQSVFEVAAKIVQRRFPALDVVFMYLSVPELNTHGWTPVNRIPAIKVRLRVRGRGH